MEEKKKEIRISVRNLVEFILRSGDLDNSSGGFGERDAMQAGTRVHQQIQKKRGADYRAEVPLVHEKEYEHFILRVEGRADGMYEDGTTTVIEEIKGTYRDLETMEEPVPVHLAQAKCYAYIYGLQNRKEEMGVLMTYTPTGASAIFCRRTSSRNWSSGSMSYSTPGLSGRNSSTSGRKREMPQCSTSNSPSRTGKASGNW